MRDDLFVDGHITSTARDKLCAFNRRKDRTCATLSNPGCGWQLLSGVAQCAPGESAHELIRRADMALYLG